MPSATPLPDKPLDVSLQPTPATEEAAKTLVEVHNAANVDDDFLQLMYGPLDEEADSFTSDILGIMRGDPTVRFTQAVVSSKEPGKEAEETVVGWAWWNIYPTKADYLAAAKGDKERAKKPPSTSINPAAYLEWKKGVVEKREKWLENTDKGVDGVGEGGVGMLQVLMVHPDYQRRGIGTQLVRHGLEEVNALNLPAWLEASDEGAAVYTKCGFRNVHDDVVVDKARYGLEGLHKGICMLYKP